MPAGFIVGMDPTFNQEDYKCSSFDYSYLFQPHMKAPFDYKLKTFSLQTFTWLTDNDLMNTLAIKLTLKRFREQRKALLELPYGWHLDEKTRKLRMNRFLPGDLSKYSEEQMLFMTSVRQNCRGSWKKFDKDKDQRYALETTILNMMMQTEEFSEVWKCPKKSFMDLGDDRCFKWMP
ncbi:unnamed protein product [Orchesella dallaii]|uniref:Uncharacterized protein n=1 Tax=Orchesella dallaii TaxID=48710 RepID=A0ABP1Q1P0_9HEXA